MSMMLQPGRFTPAGGGGAGTQRQVLVPGFPAPVYVNTTSAADKQYALPNGAYKNEQGV